jgi:hypothetical protein
MIEVGDKVDYHSVRGGPITSENHTVKSIEREPNNYGCDVAWITGKSGCVDIDALSINKDYLADIEDKAYCPHGFLAGCPKCSAKYK